MAASTPTPVDWAARRAKKLADLWWHIGSFLILNVMLWVLDVSTGGGITWAPIITFWWGVALAFHVLAYWIDGRQVERRAAQRFLDQERKRSGNST